LGPGRQPRQLSFVVGQAEYMGKNPWEGSTAETGAGNAGSRWEKNDWVASTTRRGTDRRKIRGRVGAALPCFWVGGSGGRSRGEGNQGLTRRKGSPLNANKNKYKRRNQKQNGAGKRKRIFSWGGNQYWCEINISEVGWRAEQGRDILLNPQRRALSKREDRKMKAMTKSCVERENKRRGPLEVFQGTLSR